MSSCRSHAHTSNEKWYVLTYLQRGLGSSLFYKNTSDAFAKIVRMEGARALYKGFAIVARFVTTIIPKFRTLARHTSAHLSVKHIQLYCACACSLLLGLRNSEAHSSVRLKSLSRAMLLCEKTLTLTLPGPGLQAISSIGREGSAGAFRIWHVC